MQRFVIIMATDVDNKIRYANLVDLMRKLKVSVNEWSIDLGDSQNVLRIISPNNISDLLIKEFEKVHIQGEIMQIFSSGDTGLTA